MPPFVNDLCEGEIGQNPYTSRSLRIVLLDSSCATDLARILDLHIILQSFYGCLPVRNHLHPADDGQLGQGARQGPCSAGRRRGHVVG